MAHEVLIIDDEADIRALVSGILEDEGFTAYEATDSVSALDSLTVRRPSVVLLDIWLQGSPMDGLQILNEIKANYPDLPVLMMSGHGTIETAVGAIKDGAYDFIEKPFTATSQQAEELIEIAESKNLIIMVQIPGEGFH